MSAPRHKWSYPLRFAHKSERTCLNGCGIIKVSHHESGEHWIDFWRDEVKISTDRTPACEPVKAAA